MDRYLLGLETESYRFLGAHFLFDQDGNVKTQFTVYAPHAKAVNLIIFLHDTWQYLRMDKIHLQGFYQITINENLERHVYQYEIITNDNQHLKKADPFGFYHELRPGTGSIVYNLNGYQWQDQQYMYTKQKTYEKPMLIYEVHLGSWRKKEGSFYRYSEIVDDLIAHVKKNNFSHVELLPIYEHPLDGSWGYQGTGYFSATARYGEPKDLMYFIDRMHQAGIGVILDWVLGHICKDRHGLSYFDGTPLYEFPDQKRRENITWGTSNLDFSKGISRSFMASALTFWVKEFHVDGFRIDAVSNLFYYLGDKSLGTNSDAIAFLRQLSVHLFGIDDRILLTAEDSTAFPQVTHPVSDNGVGFNYKWNMGFMNDILKYFKTDVSKRKNVHQLMTFGIMYAFTEQFILPFSHDEVVHMKGSLINKMPGDYFQKFANWRLLMTLFLTYPGKKLLFMGQEFASFSEWNFNEELDWHLYQYDSHQKANDYFRSLTHFYNNNKPLYKYDYLDKTFEWVVADDRDNSVFAYLRKADQDFVLVVLNMTDEVIENYQIGVPKTGTYVEVINSDLDEFGGSNQYNAGLLKTKKGTKHQFNQYLTLKLGPLTGLIIKKK